MNYYCILTTLLFFISLFMKLSYIAKNDYPRKTDTKQWHDVIDIYFYTIFIFWGIYLLTI